MKNVLLLFFCVVFSGINAQEIEVKSTLDLFFKGLHNGDTITLKKAMHKDVKLQTIYKNKDGKTTIATQSKKIFLNAIASKKATDIWLEKIENYSFNIDGDLASVWTPYTFYLNNAFSHCGINSFQLVNNNGNWEIIYIVDTRRKAPCTNN